MNSRCIDPPVVEIEKRADRDGVVNRFIRPPGFVQGLHVFRCDIRGIKIYFCNEPEEGFFTVRESRTLQVAQYTPDQIFAAEQFRCNCSVRFGSEWTVILIGRVRSY